MFSINLSVTLSVTFVFYFLFVAYFCRGELGESGIVLSRYPSSTKELINLSLFLVWFVTPRRTAEAWKSSSLPNTSRMMTTLILTSTLREMSATSFAQKKKLLTFAHKKHQEQCNSLHQPSRDATVVKLRCGQTIFY